MPTRIQTPVTLAATTSLWLCAGCFDPLITGDPMGETDGSESSGAELDESSTSLDPDDSSGDVPAVCGDGVVDGDEICDDGVNDGSYGGCTADCMALGPHCGDGVLNGDEPCDDGDEVDGNGCNVDCVVSGTVLWTVTYDGPEHGIDRGWGITASSDNGIAVSGTISAGSDSQGWLRKYSHDGQVLWDYSSVSPSGGSASGSSLVSLPQGGFIQSGSFRTEGGLGDAWIRRFSDSGEPSWTQSHEGLQVANESILALSKDDSDNLYTLVREAPPVDGDPKTTLVRKYTSRGQELWTRVHDDDHRGTTLALDNNGRPVIVGSYSNMDTKFPWVQRLSSEGGEILSQIDADRGGSSFSSLSVGEDVIMVSTSSSSLTHEVVFLDGNASELRSFMPDSGAAILLIYDIQIIDGTFLVAGARAVQADDPEIWISKYQMDEVLLWTNTENGENDSIYSWDHANSVSYDSQGNIIATGTIHDTAAGHNGDIWVGKYAP